MRDVSYCLMTRNLKKSYKKKFTLDIPKLMIPQGFATALIGENGAGKSTLLNFLSGIREDYEGDMEFFGKYSDKDRDKADCPVREMIGYTGSGYYYMPSWTIEGVGEISELLFDSFRKDRFYELVRSMRIDPMIKGKSPKVSTLSDGNRMKLEIAGVLARDTELLIMDEPASPLDPLARDELCSAIQKYINEGNGKRSVFFSTHNISDMESVTDYAIIMDEGKIVEEGWVEDLKEKYIVVKGEAAAAEKVRPFLFTESAGEFGFEGIVLAEKADALAGFDVKIERPTLSRIAVAVMKHEREKTA